MAEAGKGVGWHDQPGQHASEQRAGRNHVVAPAAPQKHRHGGAEDGENQDLVMGHGGGIGATVEAVKQRCAGTVL